MLTPIVEIVKFLIFTGARLGEVLHLEFSDIDFETGVWHIRKKPKCPTFYGLGWSPKWEKERTVVLFPEALAVIKNQPRRKRVVGTIPVRGNENRLIDHKIVSADFVFPKMEISVVDEVRKTRFSRVDNVARSWKNLKSRVGISPDLQIKDLRTYFNHVLRSRYGFSSKEAGAYIGNSERVNEVHYSPVHHPDMLKKMREKSLMSVLDQ